MDPSSYCLLTENLWIENKDFSDVKCELKVANKKISFHLHKLKSVEHLLLGTLNILTILLHSKFITTLRGMIFNFIG